MNELRRFIEGEELIEWEVGDEGGESASDEECEAIVPVEAQETALAMPGLEDDSAFAQQVAETMGNYDASIAAVSADPLAANYLRSRKVEAWKMLRRRDEAADKALSDFLKKDRETMAEMRERLRQEDKERRLEKQKRKDSPFDHRGGGVVVVVVVVVVVGGGGGGGGGFL